MYEEVSETELGYEESFVRLLNSGQRVRTFKIHGYLASKIVFFLMNLNFAKCPIYISRHGESEFNLTHKIGGNSNLSARGRQYATLLGQFISDPSACPDVQPLSELALWTSTLLRTRTTAALVREASVKAAAAAQAQQSMMSPVGSVRSIGSGASPLISPTASPAPPVWTSPPTSTRGGVGGGDGGGSVNSQPASPNAATSTVVVMRASTPAQTKEAVAAALAATDVSILPASSAGLVSAVSDTVTSAVAASNITTPTTPAPPVVSEVIATNTIGPPTEWRALVEIEAGVFNGMTYAEIERKDPTDFDARTRDKLRYRYPHGESYTDVIDRLEIVIFELERITRPVLVVGHQAVLRCLYGYFLDLPQEKIPHLDVPLHTVIKLTPKAYGCTEERFFLVSFGSGAGAGAPAL